MEENFIDRGKLWVLPNSQTLDKINVQKSKFKIPNYSQITQKRVFAPVTIQGDIETILVKNRPSCMALKPNLTLKRTWTPWVRRKRVSKDFRIFSNLTERYKNKIQAP